jgi:hypothetical protein
MAGYLRGDYREGCLPGSVSGEFGIAVGIAIAIEFRLISIPVAIAMTVMCSRVSDRFRLTSRLIGSRN